MIAALPMYDRPENAAAHDALWSLVRDGLRARGVEAPDTLDRETNYMDGWARPDLVLGQMCNLPWRARFRNKVTVIGASDYGLEGDPAGHYHSVIVVRTGEATTHGDRFAYNDALSNSGWDLPQAWAKAHGVPVRPVLCTGSHTASARAVAEGGADIAAIDAVTWRGLTRWDATTAELEVIGRTGSSPGQTFVTRADQDPTPYHDAIAKAILALPEPAAATLGLRGIVVLAPSAYDLPLPPEPASFLG